MGTVVQLKNQINNSYFQLKSSVEDKLILVEEKIKSKLTSDVELVQKMTNYHLDTGGKRLRALLTLGSSKFTSLPAYWMASYMPPNSSTNCSANASSPA